MTRQIGEIDNYYARLRVNKEDGKYYWTLQEFDRDEIGDSVQEIPQYLFEALNRFQDEQEVKQ